MNNVEPQVESRAGILLTDQVDMTWLQSVTPRYFSDYIKFVVDFETEQVYIGMDFHADCVPGDVDSAVRDTRFRGGNVFFEDSHIVYESTLNVPGNLALGGTYDDVRIISDDKTIERVNAVLFKWVVL